MKGYVFVCACCAAANLFAGLIAPENVEREGDVIALKTIPRVYRDRAQEIDKLLNENCAQKRAEYPFICGKLVVEDAPDASNVACRLKLNPKDGTFVGCSPTANFYFSKPGYKTIRLSILGDKMPENSIIDVGEITLHKIKPEEAESLKVHVNLPEGVKDASVRIALVAGGESYFTWLEGVSDITLLKKDKVANGEELEVPSFADCSWTMSITAPGCIPYFRGFGVKSGYSLAQEPTLKKPVRGECWAMEARKLAEHRKPFTYTTPFLPVMTEMRIHSGPAWMRFYPYESAGLYTVPAKLVGGEPYDLGEHSALNFKTRYSVGESFDETPMQKDSHGNYIFIPKHVYHIHDFGSQEIYFSIFNEEPFDGTVAPDKGARGKKATQPVGMKPAEKKKLADFEKKLNRLAQAKRKDPNAVKSLKRDLKSFASRATDEAKQKAEALLQQCEAL